MQTFTLKNYYEDYFSGQKSLDKIGEEILNFYDKATGEFREEYETLADYSRIKNKLSFMFINRHRNRDILKQLEVLARTEKIEADSEEDAYNIARIRYNDVKVVLNEDDLTDREIKMLKSGAGGSL